ncbi:MAG: hypothetical protein E7647_05305 [Ruminococcaceae bacterium]|nr:hypothetical protein [Oscillospiraceae bacterium]
MSDNNGNRKSPTAQDLLSRLQKSKTAGESTAGERKNATYQDFIAKREKPASEAPRAESKPAPAPRPAPVPQPKAEPRPEPAIIFDDEIIPDDDFASIYDEIYAEAEEPVEETVSLDEAAADFFGEVAPEEEAAEDYSSYESYEAADDFADFEPADVEIPAEEVFEEIGEYEEYADVDVDYSAFAPEEAYTGTYADEPVVPVEGEYYEDVIPDDDFFDNDPIEEYEEEEYYEEPAEDEEYDETKDFENLVNEVTGGAPVDELDETDISLMVALGMEDELVKTMGEDAATQMTDDYVADQEEWVDRTNRFGADEYTDISQNGDIAEEYKKRNRVSFWKMIIALGLTLFLFFFENLPLFGAPYVGAFDPAVYPIVHIMADLQVFLILTFIVGKNILKGIKDAVSMKPSVDCLPAIISIAAIVNSVVMAVMTTPDVQPRMFNFAAAFCLLFAAINEYMTVRREIFSFNIISSKKPKFVMRRLSQRDSVLESEAVADMDSQAADEGDIIKIQKTDFVDGYFWRTGTKGTVSRSVIGLAAVISIVLAVVVAIYAFIIKEPHPVNVGFSVLSAAIPASMVLVGCYPFYRANRRAYDSDSTIIGEGSIEEYSGVGVISFDDVNVFPSYSVKVRNVRLFNNSRIDKVLYYAASVFSATGGPLADVFEVATMETGHSENVRILETGTGYIEAEVNGRSLMFGRAQAFAKHGILIPDDIVAENAEIPADCSVMYMIYQRKLVAKMIVNYVLDPDFEYVLKQLTGSGMCVCVKTFDPNIDEDMILRQLPQNSYAMRVIKYKNTEEITKYSQHAEGGIVSRGNTKALLHTVASCDKILSAQKAGFAIGVISAILNAVIVAVVLMSGMFRENMFSVYTVLCQLFWLIPVVITTKMIVR